MSLLRSDTTLDLSKFIIWDTYRCRHLKHAGDHICSKLFSAGPAKNADDQVLSLLIKNWSGTHRNLPSDCTVLQLCCIEEIANLLTIL